MHYNIKYRTGHRARLCSQSLQWEKQVSAIISVLEGNCFQREATNLFTVMLYEGTDLGLPLELHVVDT